MIAIGRVGRLIIDGPAKGQCVLHGLNVRFSAKGGRCRRTGLHQVAPIVDFVPLAFLPDAEHVVLGNVTGSRKDLLIVEERTG